LKKELFFVLLIVVSLVSVSLSGCTDSTQGDDGGSTTVEPVDGDYFANKAEVEYADYFSVDYHDNYKHVVVTDTSGTEYSYILVQKGTAAPENDDGSTVIEIPVDSIVTLSTTHLPALEIISELDTLKAVNAFSYINSGAVREIIDNGELEQVGSGSATNTEKIVALNPDIVMTTVSGYGLDDEHISTLRNLGQTPVVNQEHNEKTPLGRAEWIKFVSLFYNKEQEANEYFDAITADYESLAATANAVEDKPTVMAGMSWEGTWYVPGGESFVAEFIEDAGGSYVWADVNDTGSVTYDFESVFNRSQDAEYWLSDDMTLNDMSDLEAQNPLFLNFRAAQSGNVYSSYGKVNQGGGNDYYESGLVHPDIILEDLISIFHPELLPDHELVYYKHLENTTGGQ
jgi:iron complex transport system substrate-binding protein